MPSKPVIRRQKAADVLRSAIKTHQDVAAESLTEVLTPLLAEGETVIDLATFQSHLLRLVTRHEEEMVAADQAHDDEIKGNAGPRRRRDRIARDLGQRLRQCRQAALGAFDADEAKDFLKLDGSIDDRDAESLLRQVRQVVSHLRNTNLAAPSGVLESSTFDREGWADMLEPPMEELQAAVDAVADEVSDDQETRVVRLAALDRMDDTLITVSHLMQYVYRLGGNRGFESAVVPILRRRARPSTQEGETPPAGEETGNGGPESSPPNPPDAPGGGSPRNSAAT